MSPDGPPPLRAAESAVRRTADADVMTMGRPLPARAHVRARVRARRLPAPAAERAGARNLYSFKVLRAAGFLRLKYKLA